MLPSDEENLFLTYSETNCLDAESHLEHIPQNLVRTDTRNRLVAIKVGEISRHLIAAKEEPL